MPYIEAKLSIELNDNQKDELQAKLANAVSLAFSKPNAYIMTNIEDEKSLYMGGKNLKKVLILKLKHWEQLLNHLAKLQQKQFAIF